MFQGRGCPVWGTQDTNISPYLEKLPKEKILVFDLSTAGVQVTGDVNVVKTSLQLDKFSCGVESVVSAVFNENDKAQCVFVADTAEEATAGMVVASCVRSAQTINKMKSMIEDGITEKEWTEALIR
ncbi:uncharacterized protein LOC111708667 [Eurytemora carolleeae]|uniref:uncharacterized protein LOC111708667 n=1 Tax=Eurytemora carolleeae TaxID=1294199 RepID=UPI000C775EAF|nr:uncharacterized protein LOC111708667 [Eurytemora carolleeae]|eukprot:XP_023337876.1 uncharacterized protein LOC111708667 [Eurytemora affinis]